MTDPTAGLLATLEQESAKAPEATPTTTKPKMRNYHQMKTAKLAGCVRELRARSGDAYERCVNKGGDPEEDLKVAEAELAQRGGSA